LVVLVLVGLMAAFAAPRVGGSLTGLQLRTTARKVAATFRLAAQRAMAEQVVYAVRFDDDTGLISLAPLPSAARIPDPLAPQPTSSAGTLDRWQVSRDLRLGVPVDDGPRPQGADDFYTVFFSPSGGGSGGVVRLAAANGRQMEVRVDFITGETTIREVEHR
jgi:Tfp pilus assembly protein FimT